LEPFSGEAWLGKWAYNQGMETCPKCYSTIQQHKAGLTKAGSQRYHCMTCGKKYTPVLKRHGYNAQFHRQAMELVDGGMNLREAARHLGIIMDRGSMRQMERGQMSMGLRSS